MFAVTGWLIGLGIAMVVSHVFSPGMVISFLLGLGLAGYGMLLGSKFDRA